MTTPPRTDLSWLLEELVSGLPDAESAVLLSTDGLLMGHSTGLERTEAERFAAMASAFHCWPPNPRIWAWSRSR
ncbi:roadblock/LC7 domain-containing protein [Nocardia rhamnosiphila]|uniref:roadblock/LC7 domain-containing protein n=1 Tax=Nocardia rhamnosiphila TaxID=426716 RepID=UPI0004C3B5DF